MPTGHSLLTGPIYISWRWLREYAFAYYENYHWRKQRAIWMPNCQGQDAADLLKNTGCM